MAYALGTQPLSIYTRHATLLERSSLFPTHPLPERASSNKRNKRRRDFLSFSHSLRVLRATESINLSLSLPLVFSAAWNLISASRLDGKAGIRFLKSLYLCTPLGNEGGWNNGHHHRLSYDRYRIVGKRGEGGWRRKYPRRKECR